MNGDGLAERAQRGNYGRSLGSLPGGPRRGLSLLEIMIATTILLVSVMALSRLAFLCRRHIIGAEDKTKSQMLCENILNEILSGIRPLENVSSEPFEGGLWAYSVDVQELDSGPLLAVAVTVERLPEESELTASGPPSGDVLSSDAPLRGYRLVRWIRSRGRSFDASGMENGLDESDGEQSAQPLSAGEPMAPDLDP